MAAAAVEVILMLTLYYYTSLASANNLLAQYDSCLCPEDVLVFVCSVNGGGATIWKGSFFNCPGTSNEIILRHSAFENAAGTCNGGNIVAYNIDVANNTYSSQLNVTVSPEMHNETVECIHDTQNATSVLVGAYTLILATEPPGDIHISDISPNQLTVRWSPASPTSSCPPATYDIATDCGMCPNTTSESDTLIRCTNLIIDERICSIVIHTKACRRGSHEHRVIANLTVVLSVPGAPDVTATWINQFTSILTSFNETEEFFISEGIDGSATNYTITYSVSDSTSGRSCYSVTIIPASACTGGQCNHTFDIPSTCVNLNSITLIAITVLASNVLGDGPSSEPFHLKLNETIILNQDVDIDTTDTPSIILYSIVGGSSVAVILFLLLVITILAGFLKKIHTSFRRSSSTRPKNNPEQGATLHVSPEHVDIRLSDDSEKNSFGAYADLSLNQPEEDEATDSCEIIDIIYENNHHKIDKTLNLDTLLIQIRHEVAPKWYQFGLAVGINKETLDEFSNFTPEECIVEISDLWLRTSVTTLTWRDVADALKETGCYRLAEKILKVYKTGILPADHEAAEAALSLEQLSMVSNDQDGTSESSQPDRPPLPPNMYL